MLSKTGWWNWSAAGVPAHEGDVVEERLDEGEDRAVHVVDGRGEEEQKADEPAHV